MVDLTDGFGAKSTRRILDRDDRDKSGRRSESTSLNRDLKEVMAFGTTQRENIIVFLHIKFFQFYSMFLR